LVVVEFTDIKTPGPARPAMPPASWPGCLTPIRLTRVT